MKSLPVVLCEALGLTAKNLEKVVITIEREGVTVVTTGFDLNERNGDEFARVIQNFELVEKP